jgi:hypothetical protein
MVGVTHPRSANRYPSFGKYFLVGLVGLTVTLYGFLLVEDPVGYNMSLTHFTVQEEAALRHERLDIIKRPQMVRADFDEDYWGDSRRRGDKPEDDRLVPCNYQSIDDFTPEERMPVEGFRHMITPPQGGKLSVRSPGWLCHFLTLFWNSKISIQFFS